MNSFVAGHSLPLKEEIKVDEKLIQPAVLKLSILYAATNLLFLALSYWLFYSFLLKKTIRNNFFSKLKILINKMNNIEAYPRLFRQNRTRLILLFCELFLIFAKAFFFNSIKTNKVLLSSDNIVDSIEDLFRTDKVMVKIRLTKRLRESFSLLVFRFQCWLKDESEFQLAVHLQNSFFARLSRANFENTGSRCLLTKNRFLELFREDLRSFIFMKHVQMLYLFSSAANLIHREWFIGEKSMYTIMQVYFIRMGLDERSKRYIKRFVRTNVEHGTIDHLNNLGQYKARAILAYSFKVPLYSSFSQYMSEKSEFYSLNLQTFHDVFELLLLISCSTLFAFLLSLLFSRGFRRRMRQSKRFLRRRLKRLLRRIHKKCFNRRTTRTQTSM